MDNFWGGFEKRAKKEGDTFFERNPHIIRRHFLTNTLAAPLGAKKGKKGEAFKENFKQEAGTILKDTGIGLLAGIGLGALLGKKLGGDALIGAGLGGYGGAQVGMVSGALRGTHGEKGVKTYKKYVDTSKKG